jgi:hypothetical protein
MGRALMIVLIFVVAGPLIGLVTFSALLTIATASQREAVAVLDKSIDTGDPAALGLFVMLYGLVFAHFAGALWAAIAGALVALRAHLWGPGSTLEGVPIGLTTALASLASLDIQEMNSSSLGEIGTPVVAGWILIHIIPTTACLWLTRRWQVRASSAR